MPELPEVETIKLGLQRKIVGLTLKKVQILSHKTFSGNPNQVAGEKVEKVWRRAKILGINLSSHQLSAVSHQTNRQNLKTEDRRLKTLLFHLKMTGQLVYVFAKQKGKVLAEQGSYDDGQRLVGGHPTPEMRDSMPNSHTRVIFSFSDGSHLYFNDQRRFGWIKLVQSEKGKVLSQLENLGPEPLEKGFSWQILKQNLLRHKSMPIKVALMDPKVVSGVGNIYANEACFDAKLDPRTKVSELSEEQFKKLHRGVVKSLKDGIKHGGSSRAHFVDAEGHKGYFLDYAYVYGRDKHPCKVCKTEIKKITLGGRGTYFCPRCQR